MNLDRFDRLARRLAAGRLSRRAALRGLGGGAVALRGLAPATPAAPAAPVAMPAPGAWAAAVAASVRGAMAADHIAGLGLAVVADGRVALAAGYGLAGVAARTPATAATPFAVGSVTKAYTALGVLLLVDRPSLIVKPGIRALDLDAPMRAYLSPSGGFALPTAWAAITPRQLLSMTGGVPDGSSQTQPWQEIVARVGRAPLVFPPGTGYCYSNPGFMVLGALIEQLGGRPYAQFMAEEVFAPLGLAHTLVRTAPSTPPGLATGYAWSGQWTTPPPRSPRSSFSAGAVATTATDVGAWLAALVNRRLLSAATYQTMWGEQRLPTGPLGWGLGWAVTGDPAAVVGKDGALPGYTAQILLDPAARLAVGLLCNADGRGPALLHLAVRIAGAVAARPLPALTSPHSQCPTA